MRCHFNSAREAKMTTVLLQTHRSLNALPNRNVCSMNALPLTWAWKKYEPLLQCKQCVCVCVCVNLVLCVRFECVWMRGLQESVRALNGLNTGKNEEMQFINFSDDVTLPRLCKWQFLSMCSVQLAYRQTAMCGDLSHLRVLRERERKRVRWFTQAVINDVLTEFSLYFEKQTFWKYNHKV